MRTTSHRSETKILPSPTWPVWADLMMVSNTVWSLRVGNDDFHLDLGHEVDFVLRPPVHLGMALLAAEAADFGDGHARHAAFGQGCLDIVEFEMADDGFNFFHNAGSF